MNKLLLLSTLIFLSSTLLSQSRRAVVSIDIAAATSTTYLSSIYEVPLQQAKPFLSYFLKWEGELEGLQLRFSEDAQSWSAWQLMPRDEHAPDLSVSHLQSSEVNWRFFQIQLQTPTNSSLRLECHFFSPGHSPTTLLPNSENKGTGRACSDFAPPFLARNEWCPQGNCAEHPAPVFAQISHVIIHHSAGSNEASDWPAVVRSIWDFHVNGRGWSDIGYNWLVDPEGRIYQGRTNDIIGAHFCGTNTGTLGVCLLGNFEEAFPKQTAIDALQTLLLWKTCEYEIDPVAEVYHASSDKILPTIVGHRDGCATACPGEHFYPQIPDIRTTLVEPFTDTKDIDNELGPVHVFPNPTSGQLNLALPKKINGPVHISIFSQFGQRLFGPLLLSEGSSNPLQALILPKDLPNGNYLIVFQKGANILKVKSIVLTKN